jgi:aspartate/methionine/tyrosine aminotransferase
VEALDATGVRAVVLTPAHQSPAGVVLAPERRHELLAWAGERDATIIEDDYDAEFRYDREPVGSLQGLSADRVALVGTASKALAPTLRLGWIACPPALVEAVAREKRLADRGSPGLDQLALALLIGPAATIVISAACGPAAETRSSAHSRSVLPRSNRAGSPPVSTPSRGCRSISTNRRSSQRPACARSGCTA